MHASRFANVRRPVRLAGQYKVEKSDRSAIMVDIHERPTLAILLLLV